MCAYIQRGLNACNSVQQCLCLCVAALVAVIDEEL